MKKWFIVLSFVLLVLLYTVPVFAADKYDYKNGYFDSSFAKYTVTNKNLKNVFDNDSTTSFFTSTGSIDTLVFAEPIYLKAYYLENVDSQLVVFYDVNNNVVYTSKGQSSYTFYKELPEVLKKVKKLTFSGYSSYGESAGAYFKEFELFLSPIPLDNPVIVSNSTVKTISLDWSAVPNCLGYKLYMGDKLIATLDKDTLKYTINNLSADKQYNFRLEALADNIIYCNSTTNISVRTKPYFTAVPIGQVKPTTISATLSWSALEDTDYYEVKLDSGMGFKTKSLKYVFDNLQMETDYIAYVRQVNIGGVISEWCKVPFKTLGPPEVPPDKPTSLIVTSKGIDFIEVEVSAVQWATEYKFYLDNVLIATQKDRKYKFTGLTPNTQYGLSCRSNNKYGDSRFPAYASGKTDSLPVPSVTSGKVTPINQNDLEKQKLTWESENCKGSYKIVVDGKEVATVPNNQKEYDLEFNDPADFEGSHNVEIIPTDKDGKGFKLDNIFTRTFGNLDIDKITRYLLGGLNTIKRGGLYLLGAILLVLILFVLAVFLFDKFKLNLATNDDVSLEANPDEQIKSLNSGNKFDRDAYLTAKLNEGSYKQIKGEEFNLKRLLNGVVNGSDSKEKGRGKGKGKKGKSYKINTSKKSIEVDKTTFFANKHGDFNKVQSPEDFFNWQEKYDDYNKSNFDKFFK